MVWNILSHTWHTFSNMSDVITTKVESVKFKHYVSDIKLASSCESLDGWSLIPIDSKITRYSRTIILVIKIYTPIFLLWYGSDSQINHNKCDVNYCLITKLILSSHPVSACLSLKQSLFFRWEYIMRQCTQWPHNNKNGIRKLTIMKTSFWRSTLKNYVNHLVKKMYLSL